MEMGSHGELDSPLLRLQQLVLRTHDLVTLFCTAVDRASCGEHKLLRTGGGLTT